MRRAPLVPVVLVAALAGGAAALGIGLAAGVLGGRTETVGAPGRDGRGSSRPGLGAAARGCLRRGKRLREPLGGRRHDLRVLRQGRRDREPGLAGLGLRRRPRRHDPHQLARDHERRRGGARRRGRPALRRVQGSRPDPREGRRLGHLRRRGRDQGRSEGARARRRCRSATRPASSSASPSRRSAARSATRTRWRSASSRPSTARSRRSPRTTS